MKRFFPNARKAALTGFCLAVALVAPPAQANLSITPTYVTIEGRDRYADVHLVNPTNATSTYEIRWRFFKMEEGTGTYLSQDTSVTEWDLAKHLVFTPRRVTIEPQSAQKIRLGLRLAGEPPAPGDYRAHLEFMKIPDAVLPPQADGQKKEEAKAAVGVKVNVGFSIPVIYRVGESNATASINGVKFSDNKTRLELLVDINKNASPYGITGDLVVMQDGKVIGQIKNANMFAEIQNRLFALPLTVDSLSNANIEVIYRHPDTKQDLVYDRKTVPVSK